MSTIRSGGNRSNNSPFEIISIEVRQNSWIEIQGRNGKPVARPVYPYTEAAGVNKTMIDGQVAILHMKIGDNTGKGTKTAEGLGKSRDEAITALVGATMRALGVERMNDTDSTAESIAKQITQGLRRMETHGAVKGPMHHLYDHMYAPERDAHVEAYHAFRAQVGRPLGRNVISFQAAA